MAGKLTPTLNLQPRKPALSGCAKFLDKVLFWKKIAGAVMELLMTGAIAFFTAVATKIASKSEDKLADFVVNRAPKLLGLF